MTEYQEIEIKLYVPHLETVRQKLEAAGAVLTAPRIFERNIRYTHPSRNLIEEGIILRLRHDSRTRLTYKEGGKLLESGLFSRFEAEVEISDFDTMHLILTRLGFEISMQYEKYRTTYMLGQAEVVLDEMPYGHFVEIEGDEASIPVALAQLELTQASRYNAGYAALFEIVRQNLNLPFRDLTFANFSGIIVPESALKAVES